LTWPILLDYYVLIALICSAGSQLSYPAGCSVTDDGCNYIYSWSSSHCQYDPAHDVKCRHQTTSTRAVRSWPMTSAVSRHVTRAPADYRDNSQLVHNAGLYHSNVAVAAAADLKTFSTDSSCRVIGPMVSPIPSMENHINGTQ